MRNFCSLIRTIGLLAMVFVVTALHAQDGLSDALLRLDSSSGLLGPSIATADFNNDTYPDAAVLLRSNHNFRIEVHFRFQQVSRITFASNLPDLAISAFDVNHDGSPDLVVEEPFSHQRLFIWLNDGYGAFRPADVEEYPGGSDNSYHRLASPSRDSESIALVAPGKMRVRQAAHLSHGVPVSSAPALFAKGEIFTFAERASSPNLLRGPPSCLLL